MLVLTRSIGQKIKIGKNGETTVTVLAVNRNQVRIGVEADADTPVDREEIFERKQAEQSAANDADPDTTAA